MTTHTVGYFVGSLAKNSINRKLATALVRLAPPGLQMRAFLAGVLVVGVGLMFLIFYSSRRGYDEIDRK
jgi:NAD(P)H-dependent FMN reductase